jgi:chromosomal replication initiation ATPase DnaA
MSEQLAFDLPIREALGRDAFFVSPSNGVALATLDATSLWPSSKLILIGPQGAGKTHMAHVWAADHNAHICSAADLLHADIPRLASQGKIVVEDADQIAITPQALDIEHALFHLHNLTLAEGGHILLTARSAPNQWNLQLPDLASRMQGTSVTKIDAPDDMLLTAMLLKQFDDRQLSVPPSLLPYLIKRMQRSAAHVRTLVEALDETALRHGKPISRSLAAQIFEKDGENKG